MSLWRDIIDGLPDAVIVVTADLSPLVLNPAAETMLGAGRSRPTAVSQVLRRNQWLRRMVELSLATGQNYGESGARLIIGRREVPVTADVCPLLAADGQQSGVIILLHDLSHRRGAEQSAEGEDLELRLSPAGLAHEVKNPLTGVKGAAELLAKMFPGDERAQQYCRLILDGVDRIASLVEQVLAVTGPQRLRRERVNIHRVLHQALAMAGLYPEPPVGLSVTHAFDPSLPELTGDPVALERAFLNLIRNAVEAVESQGTIRLATRMETEFHLAAEGRHRRFLRVEVVDDGKGIAPEKLGQLFTPFFTTKPGGTGLGLVLSRRIIALHGGKLWAEPGGPSGGEDGRSGLRKRGMTFRVILPLGDEETRPRGAPP